MKSIIKWSFIISRLQKKSLTVINEKIFEIYWNRTVYWNCVKKWRHKSFILKVKNWSNFFKSKFTLKPERKQLLHKRKKREVK